MAITIGSAIITGQVTITDTIIPVGQQAYTTSGTYSWTAPAGVTSICVICVGGGGAGGNGNQYGGGGGGGYGGGAGADGAVRIIWGPNRSFPSTNTADQTPVP